MTGSGCATSKPLARALPDQFPNHSATEIGEFLRQGTDTLRAYSAESNAAIASAMGSGHFTARTRHRRNDTMRVDVTVQFGIEASRILFTPDSFYVYDRIKNTVYHGDISNAARLLPTPWISPELFLDVLGFPDTDIGPEWTVTADSTRYYLTNETGRISLFVDPTRWRIERLEMRTDDNRLVEQKSYLDFRSFDGLDLPSRIVIRRPVDKISATIQHRAIDLNPESIDLTFPVKDDATYVPIN
ncbi:MAG: DUF4292 domain-containing protein [Rhodothermia bacterium]|nr:DUF4292 domain-containing protein [Rhodothermia bacterium]